MTTPTPRKPVRGSSTGRPIMALLDLLGRRWVLRIIWELRDEALSYNLLRERCDSMSTSVLSQRLRDLRDAHIIIQNDEGYYHLTSEGQELLDSLQPLSDWAQRWSTRTQNDS